MFTLCAKSDGSECLLPQFSSGSPSDLLNDRCSASLHSWLEMQQKVHQHSPCLASETLELAIVFMRRLIVLSPV